MEVLASLACLGFGVILFNLGRHIGAEEERQLLRGRNAHDLHAGGPELSQAVRLIGPKRPRRNTADPEQLVEPHSLSS
jgi:hypothetical protein